MICGIWYGPKDIDLLIYTSMILDTVYTRHLRRRAVSVILPNYIASRNIIFCNFGCSVSGSQYYQTKYSKNRCYVDINDKQSIRDQQQSKDGSLQLDKEEGLCNFPVYGPELLCCFR